MPYRPWLFAFVWLLAACSNPPPDTAAPVYDPNLCVPGKRVLSADVLNARDLGAVLLGAEQTRCGALFRGAPLAPLTETGCAHVQELGLRTIIDLRTESERDAKPDAECLAISLNVVHAPLPIPYDVSPADYIADLNSLDSMALAFAALGDDAAYPIYFHCTWGRDRTGVLAAVILRALGANHDDILREYMLSSDSVGAYPESLRAALDELESQGGVSAYLDSLGVTEAQRATLRAHAVAAATAP